MIDGDHSYPAVGDDFYAVKDHAGIIFFHDICATSCPDVVRWWNDNVEHLRREFHVVEFLEHSEEILESCFGIGVLLRKDIFSTFHPPASQKRVISKRNTLDVIKRTVSRYLRSDDLSSHNKEIMDALMTYSPRPLELNDIQSFLNIPLDFGRFLGPDLSRFMLADYGRIIGERHGNEAFWRLQEDSLEICGADGRCTTVFDTVIKGQDLSWLFGKFEDGFTVHFLTPIHHRHE